MNLRWLGRRPSPTRTPRWVAGGALAAASLFAVALVGVQLRAGAQTPPVERIVPAVQTIATGDAYAQFDVTAEGVSNLGAYEVILQYDAAVLAFPSPGDGFVGAENGPFLESSGRTATCQPPIVNDVPATTKKQLRFGCNTTGSAAGATGSGTLATIRLKPVAIGTSALTLSPSMSDPFGNDVFAVAVSGSVIVLGGPTSTPTATSTPCPGGCPTATPTMPSAPTCGGATSPTICFDPASVVGNPGVEVTVDVDVAGVSDLGAFNFVAAYDASLLDFVGFAPGPFLGATNRTLFCLPTVVRVGTVDETCVTLGTSPDGPSGGGVIGTLHFVPKHNGIGTLRFDSATFLNPNAQPASGGNVAASDADVTIVDCASACVTVTPSPTPTQSPTAAPSLTPTPSQTATPCSGVCPTATQTPTVVPFTPTATPGNIAVHLSPASQVAAPASPFSVDVDINGATNVGAFQFTLRYHADRVAFVDAQPGAFLGSSGRTVQCNAPIVSAGVVAYGCFTYNSGSAETGAGGSGSLANVTLEGCGGGDIALTLSDVVVISPSAQAMPTGAVTDGSVTISGSNACPTPTPPPLATETSTPCASNCPTATPTNTPSATATAGSATPTATPDTNTAHGFVTPAGSTVTPGDQITLDVNVDNVNNLGAYEFTLSFASDSQPTTLQFAAVQDAGYLGSTGRNVFCQPAFVTFISVRFGCATSGSPAGPSGSGTLAHVTLNVTNYGTATLSLDLFQLTDPLGGSIATRVTGGTVTSVLAATPTASSTGTMTPTPAQTATPTPSGTPTATDTALATSSPVGTDTPTATETATATETPTETASPTDTPIATDTPSGFGAGGFSSSEPPSGLPPGGRGDEPTQGGNVNHQQPSQGRRDGLVLLSWVLGAGALLATAVTVVRRRVSAALLPRLSSPFATRTIRGFGVLLAASGLLVPIVASGSNPPGAVIYKSPGSGNLFIGGTPLVFSENVAGADRGIAGFELRLRYDPEFVAATFSAGPLLSTGGRTAICETTPLHPGDVVFACTSLGGASPSAGPGVLAYITAAPAPGLHIRATKDNGVGTLLDDVLAGTRLFDENGDDLVVGQVTDANLVVRALEGDVNSDCAITVVDDQSMALRYPSTLGTLIYDRSHDLEPAIAPDDDIDIKDLQFVFGRNGSTCDHPLPEQPSPTPINTPGTPVVVTPTAVATHTATTQTPTSGTHTPSAGTPTPSTTSSAGTATAVSTSTATFTPTPVGTATSTPLAGTQTVIAAATTTARAGASSTPTRITTAESFTRRPSGLPPTGDGDVPGGSIGAALIALGVLLLIGGYAIERGRTHRR